MTGMGTRILWVIGMISRPVMRWIWSVVYIELMQVSNSKWAVCRIMSKMLNIAGQSHPTLGCQTTDLSWWPKPSAWQVSGLNVGYWSRDCEAWFQKHLQLIRDGGGDLRGPSQWKHSLKFNKASLTTAQVNEELSMQILNVFAWWKMCLLFLFINAVLHPSTILLCIYCMNPLWQSL